MDIFIFIGGVFFGALGMFWLFFWLGTSERFKSYDVGGPNDRNLYHPQPTCESHTWCQNCAEKGKYHCTVCPYVMVQDNGGAR